MAITAETIPMLERVAAAVEKSGAHVAAELVGTEEVLAAGCAPLRTDRDAGPACRTDLAVL